MLNGISLMVLQVLFAFYAFAFGACIGSFLNVCIWRIPREESLVKPPSHCPQCNARIKWYQNIPILSWCCLRGKCASCGKPISFRYVAVELLTAILFLAAFLQWAPDCGIADSVGMVRLVSLYAMLVYWAVFAGLILGSFVDLDHFWIPDRVTIGGIIFGVVMSYLVPEIQGMGIAVLTGQNPASLLSWESMVLSVSSAFAGGFVLWFLGWVFTKILHRDAMGFGDVKLVAAIGAMFGPVAVIFVYFVSSMVGAAGGLFLMARGKAKLGKFVEIPFGPYIAIATVIWMFWGPRLAGAYLGMLK